MTGLPSAAEWPSVRGSLAELPDDELPRAGRFLARLDPAEVLAAHPATPFVSLYVTGHGTLAALRPALSVELARHGLLAGITLADFDAWVRDLADPDSDLYTTLAKAEGPAFALAVLDPEIVAAELPAPWRADDAIRVLDAKVALLEKLTETFAATARGATLVLNTLPMPRELTAQLLDRRERAAFGAAWREANARLLRFDRPEVAVVDLDPLLAEGVRARDPRQSVYAKAHLTDDLLAGYAREVAHLARQATGPAKKVLVLDLDETVWGGVLGEAGPEGIEVAEGYRGEAFTRFQRVVRQLGSQGVLLAAVSKNDPEPVAGVLRDHPGMTLREGDFVQVRANWRPKHDNLAELAADLNLGADSFVFADDSSFERGLVRRELPGVAVVDLTGEPALHVAALLRDGWFDVPRLTSEDLARPSRYREEGDRRSFLESFDSLDGYLAELGIEVTLAPAAPAQFDRVSQITLRTNQFNLTAHRLSPAEVRDLAGDSGAQVLTIASADRFGEHGLVGAVLLSRDGGVLRVDNFLLSCRVFGRGIEHAVLGAVLADARGAAVREVRASYRRTAKNGKVAGFYPGAGFATVHADEAGAEFRHDLTRPPEPVPHIRLSAEFGGQES
ncbi:HAD-IIIC family phosphatase [Herbidospora mongoliensis]|uniref:HAD-IIIC family phosphatase n=1 Tax=Herbidospora mongoliensis TaxID=688067 RepID=UPI000B00CB12|nr:HAD-IIIC family phosphatase [Herbidospora mongoliensis]